VNSSHATGFPTNSRKRFCIHYVRYRNHGLVPDIRDYFKSESIDSELLQNFQDVYFGRTYAKNLRALEDTLKRRQRHYPNL